MKASTEAKLRALMGRPQGKDHRVMSRETGVEILAAYRRGVTLDEIAEAIGTGRGNVYARLGTWALQHCSCHEKAR